MLDKLKKSLLLIAIILCWVLDMNAQVDSLKTIVLKSVYVTEKKPTFNTTSREIEALTNTEMKEKGAQTLSEALSTIPGVSQLTTGAISKPVIRGLYGDRIQVNVAGLKLEDQQWEDEDGLVLSDVGVERIELIKGPASLLFGSGAMGGVVNVVEEEMPEPGTTRQNLNFKLFSNSYGAGIDYGFQKSRKNAFLLRAGIESHADYSDGAGDRVPNTRFALYNIKLGYFVPRDNFLSENRIIASFNQFGFIADSADLHEDGEESRLSREFEDSHLTVLQLLFSSKNTLQLNETTELDVTLGIQNNLRQEQERADEVDLSLLLNTFSLKASIRKQLNRNWTMTNGIAGMFQTNKNYASRIIVPDASIAEGSLFSYVNRRQKSGNLNGNFEAGLRYDHRQIITHQTGSQTSPAIELAPFNKGFNNLNGSLGESLNFKNLLLKFDLSSGFRTGNLAELSANGLHEGTPNWYMGNPDMKVEQCLNADISASWQYKWLTLRGSVFRNRFHNYIYLHPTGKELFGFDLFRYEQTDATLKGFEAGFSLENKEYFNISIDYSYLDARRDDGSWLPFSPANRLMFNGKYFLPAGSKYHNAFISFGINYTQEQVHTDTFEVPAPGYWLINAGAGMTFKSVRILLSCQNLADQKYYDFLSTLKYYGLYDMGRNIVLNVGWQF